MASNGFFRQLRCLQTTVNTDYGEGLCAWLNFFYYSLFRINTFCVFRIFLDSWNSSTDNLPGVLFCNPTSDELRELRLGKSLPREFFCDQFQKVNHCCIATVNGEIAYIHWVYLKGDHSRFLKLGDDSAEINYVVTLPEYRGRGISTAAFKYSNSKLKILGIKNLLAVIHNENVASIKSFTRAGFVETRKIISIGPFNRKVDV